MDHARWAAGGPEHDPFPSHRPDDAPCAVNGWYPHDGGVEVDTRTCPYFVGVQPSRVAVQAGDRLALFLSHGALRSAEAVAEGHVALAVGDEVVWELTVPIPADPAPYDVSVPLPVSAPAGTPVALHLHNHGANTWTLLDVIVTPAP